MGDLNARTSTLHDFVIDDTYRHIPVLYSVLCDENYVCRDSQDFSMSSCAYVCKQWIDLCISSGLKIANGRIFGDPIGRYTCHKYNGSSLVDYVLADDTIQSQMRYFKVGDLIDDLSDHCLICFGIAVSVTIQKPQ